jgi:hypothetical protein
MQFPKSWVASCATAILIAAALLPLGSTGTLAQLKRITLRGHGPMQMHRRRDQTTAESYNWSGYAVTGLKGSVTDAKASWIVPAASSCPVSTPPGEGPYSAFWVGIDGWSSNSVEQIGTDSDCVNLAGTQGNTPTYYAWFEFYPQNPYLIGSYNASGVCESDCVYPGDNITAEVLPTSAGRQAPGHGGQQFTVKISDLGGTNPASRPWSFSISSSVPGAEQSSAEWIGETPYGCSTKSGFCLLSDFGTAEYGEQFTKDSDTASATVSGKTGPIASFGKSVQQAIMVSDPSGTYMAQPSNLTDTDGDSATSFTDSWSNVGP